MISPTSSPVRQPFPVAFRRLMVNTLATGVTSTFLWFALTFWVFLETRSVVVTGVIGGCFSLTSALASPAFGAFVDRHLKVTALRLTADVSMISFALAVAVFVAVDAGDLLRLTSPWFWLLVMVTLAGSVAGQLRGIVVSTCVTLLVPEQQRDRANGLVGTVTGVSFAVTSVFSGLVIGRFGMGWALYAALVLTVFARVQLRSVAIDEPPPTVDATEGGRRFVDVGAAVEAVRGVPGLGMLIALGAFNNLLGGVFMAVMDAYGLSLVSVETWGLLWGGVSVAMILGGLIVARRGLGRQPLRLLIGVNLVNWIICATFALRSSIVPLAVGMFVWMLLMPIVEAAEQTLLQRTIPFDRQGRVFGFAQLIENAAAPVTSFLAAPMAEVVFMPLMNRGGAGADAIGAWFGVGPARGIALMFTLAGLVGLVGTLIAVGSRSYRRLSAHWASLDAREEVTVATA